MKSKHKILSFVLSIAMLVTCFIPMQVTHAANAELVDESAGKARLVLKILKEDSTNDLGYSEMSQSEVKNLKSGSDFYLGVRFENLANVINVSDVGLGRIGLAIAFDNEYLSVEPDVKTANRNNLNAAKARQAIGDRLSSQSALGDEYGYAYAVNFIDEATTSDRPGENFNVLSYSLQSSVEEEGICKGGDAYIAIIAFRITKDAPTGGYNDALRFSETANQFSMEVGISPASGAKYRAYQSVATTGFGLFTDAIDFDGSGAVIFPEPQAATKITAVTVDVDAPVVGEKLATSAKVTATPTTGVKNSTVAWSPSATNAAAVTAYTAKVTVNAADDHEFNDDITVTGWTKDASSTKTALVLTKTFPVTGKNKLNALNITGLVAPETGKAPVDATKIKVANATVSEVTWDTADNPFKPATAYKVTFKATPADAYELADTLTATANAGTATATKNADGTANVEVTFGKTAAGDIKAVTLTATAPVKNQSPAEPTVSGKEYTVKGTSTWNPAVEGGKFAGEKEYTQTVVLTAAEGYKFASSISTATVAGAKAVKATPNADGSELTIEITWPATDGKEVKALELNGPDKTTYKYGETIDLTGLTATITWDDDSVTRNIALADFAANGLVCDTKTGDSVGNVGTKTITVTKGIKEATVDLTIEKADVTFTWAGLTQTEGSVNAPTVTVTPVDPTATPVEIKMWDVNATPAAYTGCDCALDQDIVSEDHEDGCNGTLTPAEAGFVPFDGSKLTVGTTTVQAIYSETANTNDKTEEATLTVNARRSGGGGGSGMLTVRFDAGVNGKIAKGSSTVKVAKNEKLKSSDIPTVTANEGYRFLGWTLDGSKTVDPTKDAVTSSITYRALYNTGATHGVYMRGDSDGNFYPERNITRAEAAALIARLNANYNEGTKYSSSLTDVAAEEWYASAVNFCASSGLITGYDDGTFLPNNQITRQEFCAIVARYLSLNNAGEANFSDIDETIWGAGYISQLAGKGIINGYEDGTFAPNAPIKRCEVVKILNGVFDRTPDASTVNDNIGNYSVRIPDISANHWAYYEILEAAVEHDHADFHKAN